jgi:hypothetical protein
VLCVPLLPPRDNQISTHMFEHCYSYQFCVTSSVEWLLVNLSFELPLLQMVRSGLVVRLTRCEGTRGFPALLAAAARDQDCPLFPEYVVYQEYLPYQQGQFFCECRLLNEEGNAVQHIAGGVGLTVTQAVHEAAHTALSTYRGYSPYLASDDSDFRHFPASAEGPEGIFHAQYSEGDGEEDSAHRALIELVRALDLRARQWYTYAIASRESHRATMRDLEPYFLSGALPRAAVRPRPLELPDDMRSSRVGGIVPSPGPPRVPRGSRNLPPYGNQPESSRVFNTPPVRLPRNFWGYY